MPRLGRRPPTLERRVATVIAAQLVAAAAFVGLGHARGASVGRPGALIGLAAAFALAGMFEMSLELHRHRFTFTLAEAVLAVGFFVAGPLGLAIAAAAGEGVDMVAQRHSPLKVLFNVSNRLAAATVAGVAFLAFGRADVHDAGAWAAALCASVCFSVIDVVSTSIVVSFAERTSFHHVFVRSVSTGVLATLASAPVGLVALVLEARGPFVPLLLAPLAVAVACNSRYAVNQRDEHLRFERLYESSARTAGLVALDDALGSLAAEARALGTGIGAICCAPGPEGDWVGAYVDDDGRRTPSAALMAASLALAEHHAGEVDLADSSELSSLTGAARSAIVVGATHERAGRVVLVVFRDGVADRSGKGRVETLGAFATHASLIVANALLHEERAIALARQVDLNRQKSDFVAAVSHELRTPLAVMLGSVHTLDRLDGRMSEEQRAQLLDMTIEQGGRLQRLIDELLLVAAAEHSTVSLANETVDVQDLLASVVAESAAGNSGRVTSHVEGIDEVVTDRSKLERILRNLVENAVKYAPDAPIEVYARRAGFEVQCSVVDHGPGIPADDRERVFERFVQLDQSSTRRQGGTGLGLHLCRQLAELVDGRLELSETPGGGCTFTLAIPARLPEQADATPAPVVDEPRHVVRARPNGAPHRQRAAR